MSDLRLGINIDHVATLRQTRYAAMPESKNAEPDPIAAASICERAGAGGIVAHLRGDLECGDDRPAGEQLFRQLRRAHRLKPLQSDRAPRFSIPASPRSASVARSQRDQCLLRAASQSWNVQ